MTPGYRALREGTAWLDLEQRGRIRVTGADRARLLHALTTNHIQDLQPGQGCYAFFLDAQGHILADAHILCLADHFLLDVEPERREWIAGHIDAYVMMDDAALEDASAGTTELAVEGPKVPKLMAELGAPVPQAAFAHAGWGSRLVARLSATGAPGLRIFAPVADKPELIARLEAAGAAAASADDARVARIENAVPRYGEDILERHLPQETQLLHAIHFNKGCYLGQEIVERIRARGRVHRLLVQMAIDSGAPPAPGVKVIVDGTEAGEITSSAFSPARGRVLALGYVRAEHLGSPLETADGARVELAASRPLAAA